MFEEVLPDEDVPVDEGAGLAGEGGLRDDVPGRVEDRPGVGHGLLAVGAVPDEAVGEEGQGDGGVHEGPAALVLVAEGVVGAPVNA